MIQFNNLNQEIPYLVFKEKYNESLNAKQKNIEAISISSFNKEMSEVDSRYVNLKLVTNDEFIFFSNYNSPKAISFLFSVVSFKWSSKYSLFAFPAPPELNLLVISIPIHP